MEFMTQSVFQSVPTPLQREIDIQKVRLSSANQEERRDAVTRLGVGLIRLERRRHRMSKIFTTPTGGRDVDAV